ncbi:hypothetical protein [Proteus terrae]|uniref:hypothetical protein n=1 Tax=Proteus terrae TaxID=1574161 RepID=UPI00186942A8|nr:hypothetical protein [Proteus terrae]MBG2836580.1 hypothetical protein [Proteus terrae subsp. cibarius]MBG2868329.1 hypothetical protein [Proteus terrae subsp. cibarius]MBJ2108783.1 hypothetical protein [Proteus terrae]MBJ2132727.1 hypothetical protein [Proteus terrae]MCO7049978.1 hypothetical protein [Proteus terrae]
MEKNAKSAFIATVLVGKKSENNERDVTNIGYITFFITRYLDVFLDKDIYKN